VDFLIKFLEGWAWPKELSISNPYHNPDPVLEFAIPIDSLEKNTTILSRGMRSNECQDHYQEYFLFLKHLTIKTLVLEPTSLHIAFSSVFLKTELFDIAYSE